MITTIFCILDDFCKEFEQENKKYFIEASGQGKRNRSATLTPSEILTILILFHHSGQRTFKNYYEVTIKTRTLDKLFLKYARVFFTKLGAIS